MAIGLPIGITTISGGDEIVSLEDVLKAMPRHKQLILTWDHNGNQVIANVAGSAVATADDVASAVGAAYCAHLKTVQTENPFRKRDPSYIAPAAPNPQPLVGDTISKSALPSQANRSAPGR